MNFCTYSKYYVLKKFRDLKIDKNTFQMYVLYILYSRKKCLVMGWKQTDLCQNPAVRWNREKKVTSFDDVKFYKKNIKKNYSIEHYTTYPITHFQELNSTLKSTSYDPARLRSAHQLKTESTARKSSFVIFFSWKKNEIDCPRVFLSYIFFLKKEKRNFVKIFWF